MLTKLSNLRPTTMTNRTKKTLKWVGITTDFMEDSKIPITTTCPISQVGEICTNQTGLFSITSPPIIDTTRTKILNSKTIVLPMDIQNTIMTSMETG